MNLKTCLIHKLFGAILFFAGGLILLLTIPSEAADPEFFVVGHRGAAGLRPENTLAAISEALKIGVDAVEFDVQLSADGQVVVMHDLTLKPAIVRQPDGEWLDMWDSLPVRELSLAQLKTYDVGRLNPYSTYAQRYPDQQSVDGERIPTLREVIALLKHKGDSRTGLWIEIKTSPEMPAVSGAPEALAAAVLRVLQEEDFVDRSKILSFDWRALAEIAKSAPGLERVYLSHVGGRLNNIKPGEPGPSPWTAGVDVDDFDGSIPHAVRAAGGRSWSPHYKHANGARIDLAHRLGMKVYVWTPDRAKDMQRLIELGVDGITTNRPDILMPLAGRGVP